MHMTPASQPQQWLRLQGTRQQQGLQCYPSSHAGTCDSGPFAHSSSVHETDNPGCGKSTQDLSSSPQPPSVPTAVDPGAWIQEIPDMVDTPAISVLQAVTPVTTATLAAARYQQP